MIGVQQIASGQCSPWRVNWAETPNLARNGAGPDSGTVKAAGVSVAVGRGGGCNGSGKWQLRLMRAAMPGADDGIKSSGEGLLKRLAVALEIIELLGRTGHAGDCFGAPIGR